MSLNGGKLESIVKAVLKEGSYNSVDDIVSKVINNIAFEVNKFPNSEFDLLGTYRFKIYRTVGYVLLIKEKFTLAIEAIEKAIELNSKDSRTWAFMGHCKLGIKDYKNAIVAFTKAFELDPKDPELCAYLSIVYYMLGQKETARNYKSIAYQLDIIKAEDVIKNYARLGTEEFYFFLKEDSVVSN